MENKAENSNANMTVPSESGQLDQSSSQTIIVGKKLPQDSSLKKTNLTRIGHFQSNTRNLPLNLITYLSEGILSNNCAIFNDFNKARTFHDHLQQYRVTVNDGHPYYRKMLIKPPNDSFKFQTYIIRLSRSEYTEFSNHLYPDSPPASDTRVPINK